MSDGQTAKSTRMLGLLFLNTSRANTGYGRSPSAAAAPASSASGYGLSSHFVAYLFAFLPLRPHPAQKMTGKQDAAAPSSSAAALLNQPIVLDTGTGTTRAGFAGGTKPKVRVCMCG